jgi:hypothetical protein
VLNESDAYRSAEALAAGQHAFFVADEDTVLRIAEGLEGAAPFLRRRWFRTSLSEYRRSELRQP